MDQFNPYQSVKQTGVFDEESSVTSAIFSIPVVMLIEGILHINNTRDIDTDRKAGVTTVANVIGWKGSLYLHSALLLTSFLSVVTLTLLYTGTCIII